jgi:hypothetical protein
VYSKSKIPALLPAQAHSLAGKKSVETKKNIVKKDYLPHSGSMPSSSARRRKEKQCMKE